MRINVPAQDADGNRLPDVVKEVLLGCGVTIRIEGSRWLCQGTVVQVFDEDTIEVHGVGFQAVVNTAAVLDCTPRDERQWQELYEKNISVTHQEPEAADAWQELANDRLG